jgi:pimeloyl-ACP methyl ester carboxylesterase
MAEWRNFAGADAYQAFCVPAPMDRGRRFPTSGLWEAAMGEYVNILGHPTWVHDAGGRNPPLLMLHGGLVSSETSWGGPGQSVAEALGRDFRLIMFDRRGHGRTADTDEPFHYSSMADETAAVIEHLDLAPVNVVGYSDGGNLLLDLALARPELLQAMVLLSANYHHDALHPEALDLLGEAAAIDGYIAGLYGARSPDGSGHWPVVAAKGLRMGATDEPTYEPADLAVINTPTLVVAADDDMFPVAHSVSLYEALPNAQLAIVPNSSHMLVFEHPELVASLIRAFFQHPHRLATIAPMRRSPSSPHQD